MPNQNNNNININRKQRIVNLKRPTTEENRIYNYHKCIELLQEKFDIIILATEYTDIRQKIQYICNKHPQVLHTGTWDTLFRKMYCCNLCKDEAMIERAKQKFIKDMNKIYGDDLQIIGEYQSCYAPIQILCKQCDTLFYGKPYHLTEGHGCPKCTSSLGEKAIRRWFNENGIKYQDQYKIQGCKHTKPLSYDFYIPAKNMLIEYQGIQHYQPVEVFGGEEAFKKQQVNDEIKRNFAIDNGYNFVEIKYDENINDKLSSVFGGEK